MRSATAKDKELVSHILFNAFKNLTKENSINYVVKQDKRRHERLKILMNFLFEKSMNCGEIWISNDERACLLLNHSQQNKVSLKLILLELHLALACIGITRVSKVLKRQRLLKKHLPNEKHIVPVILGSINKNNPRRSAAYLMMQVQKKYLRNQLPVIVNAAATKNVELYQKFGFKVIDKDLSLGFPIYFLRLN